jgi:UDP-3-O-[3-hydroxymyristoyl] glucosamine N-acyltransferase
MKPLVVSISVRSLAEKVDGRVVGDETLTVDTLVPLDSPREHGLTFIRSKSPVGLLQSLENLPAMGVFVDERSLPQQLPPLRCSIIAVSNAQGSFIDAIPLFFGPYTPNRTVHPNAEIHPTARIGTGVTIASGCVVGERCIVGDNSILDANVVLYPDAVIGNNVHLFSGVAIREGCKVSDHTVIHNNSVIGADGFGYLSDPATGIRKVPQVGIVEIGAHVEIGASTTIDRGTTGATVIGDHTKIDNQVQIGHNVTIGSHCLVCAGVGIAGSCDIGAGVVLGGGVGVADHIRIAPGIRVGGYAGVSTSLNEPGDYMGFPAIKAAAHRRQQVALRRLAATKGDKQKKFR